MARRVRSLALGAAWVAAALGAAAAPEAPPPVLVIENAARGEAIRIALGRDDAFSVTYHHSMYDQPVTEEFRAGADGRIVLRAVSSPSAAVREYFGITGPGERHAVRRAMREIVFRVALGPPQRLHAAGVERSFLDLGEPGDRLVMHLAPSPARGHGRAAAAGAR